MAQPVPQPGCLVRLLRGFLIAVGSFTALALIVVLAMLIDANESTGSEAPAVAQATRASTVTPLPSDTPAPPTATSLPTDAPIPSATPLPTNTPAPSATPDPSIPRTDPESRIACSMAERFAKERLKSPSTAQFPSVFDEINGDGCTALFNNGVWTLSSWVDSQNSFGAMIRSHYVAQLTYNAEEEIWYLQDLVFID